MRIQCISRPRSTCSLPTTGDVVLGDAGRDARRAAGADRLVDGHAPRVALVCVRGVHREGLRRRLFPHVLGERRLLVVLLERRGADDGAAFHRVVALRRGNQDRSRRTGGPRRRCRSTAHRRCGSRSRCSRRRCPRARARWRPRPKYTVTASATCPGCTHTAASSVPALPRDLDAIAVADLQLRRRRGRDQHGVVPGDLRERLRQLLQPAVVREAAVVDRRIGCERDFVARRDCGRTRTRPARGRRPRSSAAARCRRSRRRAAPAARTSRTPGPTPAAAPASSSLTRSRSVRSGRALKAATTSCTEWPWIQRRDERLDDGRRAVVRSRVAPLLQEVSATAPASGTAPPSHRRTARRARAWSPSCRAAPKSRSAGRREDRVAVEDHQQPDGAGVQVLHERGERVGARASASTSGSVTTRWSPRLPSAWFTARATAWTVGGLPIADHDEALASGREQILHRRADERVDRLRAERRHGAALDSGEDGARGGVHLTGLERQAMVRDRSGRRRRGLGDVQPVHLGPGLAHAAPVGEVARVADVARRCPRRTDPRRARR